ncbi:MAG TPA: SAM-dependent methyltransferase [Drouetiella sp.]
MKTFENFTRLSESMVWELQRQFYVENGIEFWRERSSFGAAASAVVDTIADLLVSIFASWVSTLDASEPIYIIELGAGSGCFAFRFFRRFLSQISKNGVLSAFKFRYVMTDIIPEIPDVWAENSQLNSFVELGVLDFAFFEPARMQSFNTSQFDWQLDATTFVNPPLFIANSVFDTIAADGFKFECGNCSEIQVALSTELTDASPISALLGNALQFHQRDGEPVVTASHENGSIDTVVSAHKSVADVVSDEKSVANVLSDDKSVANVVHEHAVRETLGPDANALQKILSCYANTLRDGVVTIPTEALKIIQNLHGLCDSRFALFVCSRGHTSLMHPNLQKELTYNDLSFPLNFDALQKYFTSDGGAMHLSSGDEVGRKIAAGFTSKLQMDVAALDSAFAQALARLEQYDACIDNLQKARGFDVTEVSAIDTFVDLMQQVHCDPAIFVKLVATMLDAIEGELSHVDTKVVTTLQDVLQDVNEQIYSFDRELPPLLSDSDPYSALIKTWQRANFAHHLPKGSVAFSSFND